MSNTVITNYTDLNGPSTKADSSVVVIVNKDGSLSVDQNLLGTLMGTDGSQSAGISVVRVGHEGKPDDATDSDTDDEKVPHVTLSVDSYYDEPNSIIKYDSGAEMLQSLRIETRENSLVGFQNDHCYTPLLSPSQNLPEKNDSHNTYDESIIEISHTPPPKPVPSTKKITILEQKIISKGKKILITPTESPVILKCNDVLSKPLPIIKNKEIKLKEVETPVQILRKSEESNETSSVSSSGDSIPDRDSDSDYKDTKDRSGPLRLKKVKLKPRILKTVSSKASKIEPKAITKLKAKNILKKESKEKTQQKQVQEKKEPEIDLESLLPSSKISTVISNNDVSKVVLKQTPKAAKKEKKTPAHVTALLSDMTSLFSTPDVIRRVSTDNKLTTKTPTNGKEIVTTEKKSIAVAKVSEPSDEKVSENKSEVAEKSKPVTNKTYNVKPKDKVNPAEKHTKTYDPIPQLDDVSLAQILQDTTSISTNSAKIQTSISTTGTMNSPNLAGPLSPTLDLLGGLQPEEEGLTEDFLMSVAQLVASSENLQEVIDKQVLGKVDTVPVKTPQTPQTVRVAQISPTRQSQIQASMLYSQTPKTAQKTMPPRKDPIEIVRRDGRVITLPPIEAPATRSSKRKSQMETPVSIPEPAVLEPTPLPVHATIEPRVLNVSKQYINKKLTNKKEQVQSPAVEKISIESQESWNSEDDPNRLWCICKQPHNNRFMICCDGCEDWFHGKCVNITKAMGQQMEEQGIEWRCPNCIKKAKPSSKMATKAAENKPMQSKLENEAVSVPLKSPPMVPKDSSKTGCIVCKKAARASSIYCSNNCIWKHAQDSLGNQNTSSKEGEPGKSNETQKSESRVIVYERKSGRLLAGPNAPTAENLKSWLQSNPTFEVVRPGTLSTTKPSIVNKKKSLDTNKIQTTLNFERIPRRSAEHVASLKSPQTEVKERSIKLIPIPKEESKPTPPLKSPGTPKTQPSSMFDSPKASTSSARLTIEPKKIVKSVGNRSQSSHDKAPSVSPSPSRRKQSVDNKTKMTSGEPIRDNVRKALQEQMTIRMEENTGSKFTEEEIQEFANNTEIELHELFKDVGMKYKAKYRSLMFNIKDRKNLTLWEKICDRSITPKQLVRLSPEELASQELAQWRDKEAKHQLELIKKSELDLLAASKTYVVKTHKGEEIMETKESVSTELDPNVPVEDVVAALNDSTVGPDVLKESSAENTNTTDIIDKKHTNKKRGREETAAPHSKKSRRDSKRDSGRKSRSSRRTSDSNEKESRNDQRRSMRRSKKKSSRTRSLSKDRSKSEAKEKLDSGERTRHRSTSREKARRRSKSRDYSRSKSQGRDRSGSRARSRRRSPSRDSSKRRLSSRSKRRLSSDDKLKLRSRSQDNVYNKNKHDSTDSDSVERPKSAMLKESHPEYDPHEPMITSAFSEEDLRKSREDVFEENYRNEMNTFEAEYDTAKRVDTIPLPETTYTPIAKQDKTSEVESDQEPTSTVDNSTAPVWSGCINMVDVARFYVAAHEVSGSSVDLEDDLSTELDIVGRINPDTVWDYITKMRKTSNKDIVILKLQTANDEEKMQYIALYSYLSSRNRLGVVKVSNMTTVKDFYIVPLPANTSLPPALLPLEGPNIGEIKTHQLIAIVVRQRKKRAAPIIPSDVIPAKMTRKRSYTPPASPKRRVPLPLPAYTSPSLSSTVKDKIAASLMSADDDEPYSPGSSNSSSSAPASTVGLTSNTLRNKMEELNRQIEEQKQQIRKMAQADSSVDEDEAYSPSRPMTPPPVQNVPLADISLPSNLQEILATIKQRSKTTSGDVDMRTLALP